MLTLETLQGIFQGISTLFTSDPAIGIGRVALIVLGGFLVIMGRKGVLEPLLMIPMGMGMIAVNAGVLILDPVTAAHVAGSAVAADGTAPGTLFMAPMLSDGDSLVYLMQIDALQPIYNFAFSNGLIACFIFIGIGVLLDVGFVIARPGMSMFIAFCGEFGTIVVFPLAIALGLNMQEAASIALVGGADGPMVLYGSLTMAKALFVPITVVAYLYLGLTYGGYPFLIRFLIPEKLRAIRMPAKKKVKVTSGEKLAFAIVGCGALCLLFPSAAPLFMSLFLGVAIREAGLEYFVKVIDGPILYGATLLLGLLLGVLCEASVLLDPRILTLMVLGIIALLMSGVGGICGGYILYFLSGRKFNPVIGIAGVSCVPTTAKIAQKEVSKVAPDVIILPEALGACICGVITSAIIVGIFVTLIPQLAKAQSIVLP
jgi:oxaloacetate decarboxylase beta subunit